MFGVRCKRLRHHHVRGQRKVRALFRKGCEHLLAFVDEFGFGQGLTDPLTGCKQERIGNAAAHNQLIHGLCEIVENGEFRRNLTPAHDRHQGVFGVLHGLRQRIDFRRHEGPRARHLRQPGDTFRGSLRAVRGAERVVHEHVAERRVPFC